MATSEFVFLFLDIINMRTAFAGYRADLTHGMEGRRVDGEEGMSPVVRASYGIRLESRRLLCLCAELYYLRLNLIEVDTELRHQTSTPEKYADTMESGEGFL